MRRAFSLIVALMLVSSPAWAQKKNENVTIGDAWFLTTAVFSVQNGDLNNGMWVDMGVGRYVAPFLSGHISFVGRWGAIQNMDAPTAFGFEAWYVEPLHPWFDVLLGLGVNERLSKDDENPEWNTVFVGSVAVNVKKPKTHVGGYLGGRIFQDKPGKLEAYAIGGGVVLYL